MTRDQIRSRFLRAYNGAQNFMTPNAEDYGKRGRLLYELSSGRGIDGGPLYGVTVIELDDTKRHDLSTSFTSREAARQYIRNDFVQKETA